MERYVCIAVFESLEELAFFRGMDSEPLVVEDFGAVGVFGEAICVESGCHMSGGRVVVDVYSDREIIFLRVSS